MKQLTLILLVVISGLSAQGQAPLAPNPAAPAANVRDERVDIGGRKLRLQVFGTGGPVVVLEAGLGDAGADSGVWAKVLPAVAARNQVVLYDRAGLGQSEAATKLPRTCRDVAEDIHALLGRAGIPGPYVLVGHSYGGMHVRMFAHLYPGEVAGLVLVDASHPDQYARWLAAFGPPAADEPPAFAGVRARLASMQDPAGNPERIDPVACAAEFRGVASLGDKPLAVITHSQKFQLLPRLPAAAQQKSEDLWFAQQQEMARLSSRGTLAQSAEGGHYLHVEDPELVISAIRQVLAQLTLARGQD